MIGRLRQRSWESPEGEKRSSVEVEDDEVAPSLRWATVKLERVGTKARSGTGDFDDAPPF